MMIESGNDNPLLRKKKKKSDSCLVQHSPTTLMLSIRLIANRTISTVSSVPPRSASYATVSTEKHKYRVVVVGAGAPLSVK